MKLTAAATVATPIANQQVRIPVVKMRMTKIYGAADEPANDCRGPASVAGR